MKKWIAAAGLAMASLGAHAEGNFYGLVGGGLTFGGDKLVSVRFENNDTADVRAGELVQVFTGVEYRFDENFSLQTTIGYQFSYVSADNGWVSFNRFPLELVGHVHVARPVRIGLGVRKALSPKVSGDGFAADATTDYESSVGGIVEVEYLIGRYAGVKLRGVFENYKAKGVPNAEERSGNHVGIFGTFYF